MLFLHRLLPAGRRPHPVGLVFLLDWTGTGLLLTVAPVYFTSAHIVSATQYALAQTVASLLGLLVSVPVSGLTKRWPLRRILVGLYLWRAVAVLLLLVAHSLPVLMTGLCLLTLADRPCGPLLQSLVAESQAPDARVRLMAVARTMANIGITVGALVGGGLLALDGRPPLIGAVAGDSLSFVVAAAILIGVTGVAQARRVQPVKEAAAVRDRSILSDRRFLGLTALNGVLGMHKPMLMTALPLWIAVHSDIPHYWTGLLMAVNTVMVVGLQIPLSRAAAELAGSARAMAITGVVLAGAALGFAAAAGRGATAAIVILVAVTVLITIAEIYQSAGSWGVSFAYAPEEDRARYLAVFNLGNGARDIVGPLLLTAVIFPLGLPGWAVLAGVLSASGWQLHRSVMRSPAPPNPAEPADAASTSTP
ncbi:MFS transporter [Streptomyces similanensis]|uniref:MFS transporter n=1 Tax=Streptomyces similanensis TaxID=1274988 RepID=UPI001591732A|nr:MFS transporter [Streptomyces seoulensis]